MPTPSDQPTSIAEVISTRTCPPDVDRISAWRDSPGAVDTAGDVLEDALSPASATAPSVQSRSDDGTVLLANDPLRVERKMTADEDAAARGSSSSLEESCPRGQSSVTPPNSSLLRYEFSNVRVSNADLPGLRATQLTVDIAFAQPLVVIPSFRKQVCRHAAIGSPGLQC